MATFAQQRGAEGEREVVGWLRRNGYLIVALNWRCGIYEIDIVARRGDTLHIVEVKTRRSGSLTTPEEAVDYRKFRSLRRAAAAFCAQNRRQYGNCELQFDLAAVEARPDGTFAIRFLENAMGV